MDKSIGLSADEAAMVAESFLRRRERAVGPLLRTVRVSSTEEERAVMQRLGVGEMPRDCWSVVYALDEEGDETVGVVVVLVDAATAAATFGGVATF
jgi:hypothetical protein